MQPTNHCLDSLSLRMLYLDQINSDPWMVELQDPVWKQSQQDKV